MSNVVVFEILGPEHIRDLLNSCGDRGIEEISPLLAVSFQYPKMRRTPVLRGFSILYLICSNAVFCLRYRNE